MLEPEAKFTKQPRPLVIRRLRAQFAFDAQGRRAEHEDHRGAAFRSKTDGWLAATPTARFTVYSPNAE